MVPDSFRAFLDESSAVRSETAQEYLICAALLSADQCDAVREVLRPLLLPGQVKLHWTDEREPRRRAIVERVVSVGPMNIVVSHLDARRRKVERYRRKCLESLYHELIGMEVFDLTLEARSDPQDKSDRAHVVALQGQGMDKRMRIAHRRGGDEPLLWIADIVLGAINAAHHGEQHHFEALEETFVIRERTPDSIDPDQDERP